MKQVLPVAPIGHYACQHLLSNEVIQQCTQRDTSVTNYISIRTRSLFTYVMARDGFSGKLVGAAVMPCKNNLVIYVKSIKWSLDFGTKCVLIMEKNFT